MLTPEYLVIHAVDSIWAQQINSLANEISPSTVEHPETQVQMELVGGCFRVQTLKGAETTLRPEGDRGREKENK